MKKIVIALFVVLGFALNTIAQECPNFFPNRVGANWTIKHYDGKDKLASTALYTVTSNTPLTNGYKVAIGCVATSDKNEPASMNLEFRCENGLFYYDMKNFLDAATMAGYQDMQINVVATDMQYPSSLAAGTVLPDASIVYEVSTNGMKIMTMTVNITNRKVVGIESVTVPAGTYEAYKMTYTVSVKSGFVKTVSNVTEWMMPTVGLIRTESYNEKGKLEGYSVLVEVNP